MSSAASRSRGLTRAHTRSAHPWRHELADLVRGASGGFLFGIPLLYTMEVWWIGASAPPYRTLVALVTSFFIAVLLNRTAGFRRTEDIRWADAVIDSVEAVAIGILCCVLVLVLLREITISTPLGEAVSKTVFEAVPFAIGVALANQVLGGAQGTQQDGATDDAGAQQGRADAGAETAQTPSQVNATLADIGATVIGALFIGFNIAPTDEITMLAAAISPPWLMLIAGASLVISYAIVFAAGFADEQRRHQQEGLFQDPLSETVASYLVSLATAMFMLWFFGQISIHDPWTIWLSHSIVLGLPATIGGAAGRLAI